MYERIVRAREFITDWEKALPWPYKIKQPAGGEGDYMASSELIDRGNAYFAAVWWKLRDQLRDHVNEASLDETFVDQGLYDSERNRDDFGAWVDSHSIGTPSIFSWNLNRFLLRASFPNEETCWRIVALSPLSAIFLAEVTNTCFGNVQNRILTRQEVDAWKGFYLGDAGNKLHIFTSQLKGSLSGDRNLSDWDLFRLEEPSAADFDPSFYTRGLVILAMQDALDYLDTLEGMSLSAASSPYHLIEDRAKETFIRLLVDYQPFIRDQFNQCQAGQDYYPTFIEAEIHAQRYTWRKVLEGDRRYKVSSLLSSDVKEMLPSYAFTRARTTAGTNTQRSNRWAVPVIGAGLLAGALYLGRGK